MYKEEYKHQSAFPIDENTTIGQMGMTLLDYFAAKAMKGIVTSIGIPNHKGAWGGESGIAHHSYSIAAAMMEERKKYLQQG